MASPVELFRRLTNGIYAVTARYDGAAGAFTAAWVTQVSFEPLLLAISVNPGNATWALMEKSRRFIVNVLASDQHELARHFGLQSGRTADKLAGVRTVFSDGPPILGDAIAWLDCRLEQQVPAGDHIVVLARVAGGDVLNPKATPLRYSETGSMDGSASLYPRVFPEDT